MTSQPPCGDFGETRPRPSGTVNLSASYRSVAPSVAPTALGPIVQPMRSMEAIWCEAAGAEAEAGGMVVRRVK